MTTMSSFVLVGTILSYDSYLSTIEFELNPATNGKPAIGIFPNHSIPCKVEVGKKIYVVKNEKEEIPVISCEKEALDD
jgi:hypothetical protein